MSDDNSMNMAIELWKSLFNKKMKMELIHFYILKNISRCWLKIEKGFSYKLAYDLEGGINKVIWQTATMRDNFEHFGGFICLDMMKQGINKLLQPYVSVIMYNDLEEIFNRCEGIMTVKRIEGYEFALNFMFVQTLVQSKEEVYVVSEDAIFDESIIEKFQLLNTKFMIDNFHYFTKILSER